MARTTQDKHIWMLQTCSATVYKARTQRWGDFLRNLPPVGVIVASQTDIDPELRLFESEAEAMDALAECVNSYHCNGVSLSAEESWVEECIIHDYDDFGTLEEAYEFGDVDYCGRERGKDVQIRVTTGETHGRYSVVYDKVFPTLGTALDAYAGQMEWALEQDAGYDCTLYLGDDHIMHNHNV